MTDTCGTFEDADPSFYIFVVITAVALVVILLLLLLPFIIPLWLYKRYKPNISYYKK